MGDVGLDVSESVATITMQRSHRHNTLVPEFLDALRTAFGTVEQKPEIGAVILTAEGSTFSTGGDVEGFWNHRSELESYSRKTVGGLHALMLQMMRLPLPIVVAVHGMVTGGSIGLVLAADIVLVSPEASFTPWYSVVGFSPDGGWTALLPQIIGPKRAADILHTNRTITAEDAVEWGLASRLIDRDSLLSAARELANHIAAMRPESRRRIKQRLTSELEAVERRLAGEEQDFVLQIITPEASAGMAAFLGISP